LKKPVLFLVSGMGEYAQASSFALYLEKQKIESLFIVPTQLEKAVKSDNFNYQLIENNADEIISKINPSYLFLCNSKTVYDLITKKPKADNILTLDSNWLFVPEKSPFPVIEFVSSYVTVMPKKVFQAGLKENGGHYNLPKEILNKITTVGFIPSGHDYSEKKKQAMRKKYQKSNEKLIFCYFGRGLTFEKYGSKYIDNFFQAIDIINKDKIKARVIYAGNGINKYNHYEWLETVEWFKTIEEFELTLSSCDLIVQHHGLGNLPKAIRSQIPAICFVPKVPKTQYHSPAFEIEAFVKAKLCESLTNESSKKFIVNQVESLLYNSSCSSIMKKAQKKLFVDGEVKLHQLLIRLNNDTKK